MRFSRMSARAIATSRRRSTPAQRTRPVRGLRGYAGVLAIRRTPRPESLRARRIRRESSTPAVRCLTSSRYSGSVTIAAKPPALGYSASEGQAQHSSAGPVTTARRAPDPSPAADAQRKTSCAAGAAVERGRRPGRSALPWSGWSDRIRSRRPPRADQVRARSRIGVSRGRALGERRTVRVRVDRSGHRGLPLPRSLSRGGSSGQRSWIVPLRLSVWVTRLITASRRCTPAFGVVGQVGAGQALQHEAGEIAAGLEPRARAGGEQASERLADLGLVERGLR